MTLRIVKNDYLEGDYEPLEAWIKHSKPSTWVDLRVAVVQWLKDDWRYALALAVLVALAWIIGPLGK